jgi:hypothetical protein
MGLSKKIYALLLLVTSIAFSQQNQWKGYFSYYDIKAFSAGPTDMRIAAQNAYFQYKANTGESTKVTPIEGLSGLEIVAFHYSSTFNKTILGFGNGLIQIIDESSKEVLNRIDISNRPGISLNRRKVNHFFERNGLLYIACDFGIVVFNLQTNLFGDTYFMGNGGAETRVIDTAIVGNFIYASTAEFGLKRASITNTNLIDFNNWTSLGSFWKRINIFQNQLVALGFDNSLQRFNGSTFQIVQSFNPSNIIDMQANGANLTLTAADRVLVLNPSYTTIFTLNTNQIADLESTFTTAQMLNNNLYVGTKDRGALYLAEMNLSNLSFISPEGPLRNKAHAIKHAPSSKDLWLCFGEIDIDYNPFTFNIPSYGISKWSNNLWKNIPKNELLGARAIVDIAINPLNENEVYFASYFDGLLKMVNDEAAILYKNNNSSYVLHPNIDVGFRINSLAYDRGNNLWSTISIPFDDKGIHVFRASGQWQAFTLENILGNNALATNKSVVDKNGTYWISDRKGLLGYNPSANPKIKKIEMEDSTIFLDYIRSMAIDNRNQLWIGTLSGLRVLNSIERFLTENDLVANNIIIEENGIGQELFNGLHITDIVVDGANNKWIGTGENGVYLVSPNGQQTLLQFTRENSPLPSNTIMDIDINNTTGEVFIATDRGLVSYGGLATAGQETLQNVVVYPNPVRPNFSGTVKITGLTDKANVKITDVTGSLVFEKVADGGTIEWDTTAFGSYRVASGVYMLFISTRDALETTVKKLLIVR